jgi:CMP-N,N'-diacetyllegionaminic acid synthase
MEILALIPARGGSKRIPQKNIKIFSGNPLLAYTAKASLNSSLLTRVVLTTDDEEIRKIGLSMGLEAPFLRPKELAEDDTPSLPVIMHAVKFLEENENYRPDIIVILQTTSPLRTSTHIDDAVNIFLESKADSLVSVTEVPHNMNPYSVMKLQKNGTIKPFLKYDENNNLSQKKPVFYARNGAAIYICTYNCLLKKKSLYGEKIVPFFMSKEESFDIDDDVDWKIAEYFF